MKKLLAIVLMACLPAFLGADLKAKIGDGRAVILRDDGTWIFADTPKNALPAGNFTKDRKSKLAYSSKRKNFSLSLVPGVWKKADKPSSEVAEVEFHDPENDTYAMVIAERISIPIEALRDIAIKNVKAMDPEATVVKEEQRTVNGKPMLALLLQAKSSGAPITFYGYYYTGDEGSFQIITWTGQNLFKENQPELEAFLNGFEILKK